MALSSKSLRNRTVTGRSPQANQAAAGHTAPAASATDDELAFAAACNSVRRQLASLERLVAISFVVSLVSFICFTASPLVFTRRSPEFRVVSASVSQLSVSQSELTAAWIFNLQVKYPNQKLGVYYVEASVVLGGDKFQLATTQLPSRFWNYDSTVQFRLGVTREYVNDEVVKKISKGRDRGSLDFGVRALALARFTSGEHIMRINCEAIRFGNFVLNGTGTSLGHSEKCDVHLD